MPTYDYHCEYCDSYEEKIVPMGDRDIQNCSSCGCNLTRQQVKTAGVIYRCGGFYTTDNGRNLGPIGPDDWRK